MTPARLLGALLAALAVSALPQGAAAQANASTSAAASTAGPVERYFSDALLTARVKLALLDAPDVSALDIGVQTDRGVVQLSGFVDAAHQAHRAAEIATRVPGVVEVHNVVQVKG